MKFSGFSVLTALVAVVSAATKPDVSKDPSGNPVYTPGLDEQVTVGEKFSITWDPTTEGKVSILLLRGPAVNMITIDTLADSIENTGSFSWTPSTELEDDETHYGLQIVVEGTGQYQYSNQFGIENPNEVETPEEETKAPEETPAPEETAAPAPSGVKYITTTICDCTEIPTPPVVVEPPTSVVTPPPGAPAPTGTGVPPPPPGTTDLFVTPTPVPSSPPPFEGAAGRNAVGFGGVMVAMAAALAF